MESLDLGLRHVHKADESFASMFLARVGEGTLHYVSAGIPEASLKRREGSPASLRSTAPPLGRMHANRIGMRTVRTSATDVLVVATPGFFEGSSGNELGKDALIQIVQDCLRDANVEIAASIAERMGASADMERDGALLALVL